MATPYDFRRGSSTASRDASLGEAFEHVYEAGQALIARRLELGAAEARMLARSGVALLSGAVAGVIGWLYLVAGLAEALSSTLPHFAVQMGVGTLHIAAAIALLAIAQHSAPKRGDDA